MLGVRKLLITALCLIGASQSLYAEEVLYCQSELATGFYREDGVWKSGNFELLRFTLRFNNDFTRLSGLASFGEYVCNTPFPRAEPDHVVCSHTVRDFGNNKRDFVASTFSYNKQTKRFTYAVPSLGGWIRNSADADTDVLYAGTCQNF